MRDDGRDGGPKMGGTESAGDHQAGGRTGNAESAKMRFMKKLDEYPYLKEEGQAEKREQLRLLVGQSASDALIETLMAKEDAYDAEKIDRIRSILFFTDEDFFYDRFLGSIPDDNRIREEVFLSMLAVRNEKNGAGLEEHHENYAIIVSVPALIKEFDNQRNRERKSMEEKIRLLESTLEEKDRQIMSLERRWLVKEEGGLASFIRSLADKHRTWKEEKRSAARRELIAGILENPGFDEKQLKSVSRIVYLDLPMEEIRKICRPSVPALNLELVGQYLLRKEGIAAYEDRSSNR